MGMGLYHIHCIHYIRNILVTSILIDKTSAIVLRSHPPELG